MNRERKSARIGLVGAGRTRNGLGPFLARHLAAAGGQVVAVAGRSMSRTSTAAQALAADLGHAVAAHATVEELVARGDLDALVIASPIESHLRCLAAAAGAGLPTLCEKPLGPPAEFVAIEAALARFAARGLLLVENCQWPYAMPAVRRLLGAAALDDVSVFTMRLSPLAVGWAMVAEAFSHFLSVLQVLRPLGPDARVVDPEFSTRSAAATALSVSFTLHGSFAPLACQLDLQRHETQPRPAWMTFDGRRVDREIELPRYHWRFGSGSSFESSGDPQVDLVYSFAHLIQEPDLDRTRALAEDIRQRARLFRDICSAFGGGAFGGPAFG